MMERFFGGNPFPDSFFSGTPFGDPGKRIRVRSQPVSLEVQPRPADYHGQYWLPSEQLTLRDSWAQGPPEFRVGEPVTRTLRIEARGLEAAQLPAIKMTKITGMRLYPEPPVRDTRSDGNGVIGYSEQSIAYVPSQAGTLTLPEIRVDWWDTVNHKQQTALLPSWEIQVAPGAGGTATTAAPPPADPVKPAQMTGSGSDAPEHDTPAPWRARLNSYWPWLTAGAGGVLAVGLLVGWLLHRKEPAGRSVVAEPAPAGGRPVTAPAPRTAEARQSLERACAANDAHAAGRALLAWAAATWPEAPPRSLGALGQRLEAGTTEIQALEQALYAPDHKVWEGRALWEALQPGLREKAAGPSSAGDALLPLYPRWEARDV
jgi:hypothetical protein